MTTMTIDPRLSGSQLAAIMRDVSERIRVREITISEVDSRLVSDWCDLEKRTLEPNPFLSPHFILPAVRHLTPNDEVSLLLFETYADGRNHLVGLGVFQQSNGTRIAPFPHMCSYIAPGSTFLSNLLIDQLWARQVVHAFFEFANSQRGIWNCLEFIQRTQNSPMDRLLVDVAAEADFEWLGWSFDRPVFHPDQISAEQLEQSLSKNRRKKIRRNRRQLQSQGRLSFHVIRNGLNSDLHTDTFLKLEHCGWKGEQGSSLQSQDNTRAFFREMVDGFSQQQRMIFTELRLDDVPIGSTSNFVAGGAGFAFRSGWDTDYRDSSPGVQQEIELARSASRELADLEYFDSGSDMDSWMETLWPSSRKITSGAFVSTAAARLIVSQMLRLKQWKRRLKELG